MPDTDNPDLAWEYLHERGMQAFGQKAAQAAAPPTASDPDPAQKNQVAQTQQAADKQLSPQSTNIPQLSYEPPPQLNLHDVAQGPMQQPQTNTFDVFKNPVILLAGLSSLFTRAPLTTAMNSAAGAMKGYSEGKKEVFEQQKAVFDENIKAATEQNRVELDRYNAAWKNREEANWQKTAPQLYAAAAQSGDQIMMAAIKAGNWQMVEKILLGREQAQNGLERATAIAQIKGDIVAQQQYGENSIQAAAKDYVDGIEAGDIPPNMSGVSRSIAGPANVEAAKRHLNLANMQLQWLRAQTQTRTMNNAQMTKYFALATSVRNTIGEVLDLSEQLKLGKYPVANHSELIWLAQTQAGTPQGDTAIRYLGAIKTLKEEFANLAQGGGVPTEPAWSLANQQINEDFGVDALKSSLGEVKRLIGYRVNAIQQQASGGYNPGGQQASDGAAAGGASDFTGRTATGPSGAKLRETTDGQWVQ